MGLSLLGLPIQVVREGLGAPSTSVRQGVPPSRCLGSPPKSHLLINVACVSGPLRHLRCELAEVKVVAPSGDDSAMNFNHPHHWQ